MSSSGWTKHASISTGNIIQKWKDGWISIHLVYAKSGSQSLCNFIYLTFCKRHKTLVMIIAGFVAEWGMGCDHIGIIRRISVLLELFSNLVVVVSTQKPSNLNNTEGKDWGKKKEDQSLRDTWDKARKFYIHVIRDPEAKKKFIYSCNM